MEVVRVWKIFLHFGLEKFIIWVGPDLLQTDDVKSALRQKIGDGVHPGRNIFWKKRNAPEKETKNCQTPTTYCPNAITYQQLRVKNDKVRVMFVYFAVERFTTKKNNRFATSPRSEHQTDGDDFWPEMPRFLWRTVKILNFGALTTEFNERLTYVPNTVDHWWSIRLFTRFVVRKSPWQLRSTQIAVHVRGCNPCRCNWHGLRKSPSAAPASQQITMQIIAIYSSKQIKEVGWGLQVQEIYSSVLFFGVIGCLSSTDIFGKKTGFNAQIFALNSLFMISFITLKRL